MIDNKTRWVEYVDKREFDILKQDVEALRRKVEAMGKPYGTYAGWPQQEKYALNVCGRGDAQINFISDVPTKGEVI